MVPFRVHRSIVRHILPCTLFFLCFVAFSPLSVGQSKASPQSLNAGLLRELQVWQSATGSSRDTALQGLQQAITKRQAQLASLIESDPGAVIAAALPNDQLSTMPAALQGQLEQRVKLHGKMEVTVEDGYGYSRVHYGLLTAGKRLALHFADAPPNNLISGMEVQVEGIQVGNELALTSSGTTTTTAAMAVLPNTFGAHKAVVILVNFQDLTTQPYTLQTASDVIFNQTSNFYLENSFQQTSLVGDVVGWYTIPVLSTSCDYNSIATAADQAATAAGVNLSAYSHKVYAFPSNACTWWGLGTVGGSPSQAWINGAFQLKVVGHELGHNFGLYHSHNLNCGTTTLGSSCTVVEYGDTLDIMGNPSSAHFTAYQKERLGWLNYSSQPPITTVQSNGNYSIGAYETQDGTPKALKILQSSNPTTGENIYYYVEARQAIGADSFLSSNSNVLNGVVVHTGSDYTRNASDLLNMAPSLGSFSTPALTVGQSFNDPAAGVTLQTVSVGSTGATVNVTFGTPQCAHYNPAISISPQSQSATPGTTLAYSVSVVNNDNIGCSSSTFALTSTVPSGWTATFDSSSLTISPGASASTTLRVTSPTNATLGTFSISISASNTTTSGYSSSATAAYITSSVSCSHANPTFAYAPTQSQSATAGSTTTWIVYVTNNDTAGCAASTFSLGDTPPSGWTAALGIGSVSVSPGSTVSTSLKVTPPSTASTGTYNTALSATNMSTPGYQASGAVSSVIGTACTRVAPSLTLSPSQSQGVAAGTTVTYTVSITNKDSSSCSSSVFNFASAAPAGWTSSFGASSVSLSPGGSASTILNVTSPTGTPSGTYNVTATATNANATTYSTSGTVAYVISPPPTQSLSVATDKSSYSAGQPVTITVRLMAGSSPVAGAGVGITLTKPNGSMVMQGLTTGSNGTATWKYRLSKKDPKGSYSVTASTTATTSSPSVAASTSFSVQ